MIRLSEVVEVATIDAGAYTPIHDSSYHYHSNYDFTPFLTPTSREYTKAENRKRHESIVWEYFNYNEDKKSISCRGCGKLYQNFSLGNGTSNLRHHLRKSCTAYQLLEIPDENRSNIDSAFDLTKHHDDEDDTAYETDENEYCAITPRGNLSVHHLDAVSTVFMDAPYTPFTNPDIENMSIFFSDYHSIKPIKKKKSTSFIWNYFSYDEHKSIAICNGCHKEYSDFKKRRGTTNLLTHLRTACSYFYLKKDEKGQNIVIEKSNNLITSNNNNNDPLHQEKENEEDYEEFWKKRIGGNSRKRQVYKIMVKDIKNHPDLLSHQEEVVKRYKPSSSTTTTTTTTNSSNINQPTSHSDNIHPPITLTQHLLSPEKLIDHHPPQLQLGRNKPTRLMFLDGPHITTEDTHETVDYTNHNNNNNTNTNTNIRDDREVDNTQEIPEIKTKVRLKTSSIVWTYFDHNLESKLVTCKGCMKEYSNYDPKNGTSILKYHLKKSCPVYKLVDHVNI
jgi:hypothetical protein